MKDIFPTYKFSKSEVRYQLITDENQYKLAGFMKNNNLKKLIITSGKDGSGWNHPFLPDLIEFDFIEELLVYWTNIKDIKGIHACKDIEVLWLDNDDQTEIDFSSFPKIRKFISWDRKGIHRVWEVSTIKDLTLAGLNKKHFIPGPALMGMERLRIIRTALKEIGFLRICKHLIFLELMQMNKIERLEALSSLSELRHLRIDANKVEDFSFVRDLKKLEKCYLSSKVGVFNIEDLNNLKELKRINLSGNPGMQEVNRFLQKGYA